MNLQSNKPRRKKIRLHDVDYAQQGAYFVTIVTQGRTCLFGNAISNEMVLNAAGEMVDQTIHEIPKVIPNVCIDHFIIMPNHVHFIVVFIDSIGPARRPAPTGVRFGLPSIVGRFKSLTTRRYIEGVKQFGWTWFDKKLWQRSYYEHVIRNENDYQAIVDYVAANPLNWQKDDDFIDRK